MQHPTINLYSVCLLLLLLFAFAAAAVVTGVFGFFILNDETFWQK